MRLRKTLNSLNRSRRLSQLFVTGVMGILLTACAAGNDGGDNTQQPATTPAGSSGSGGGSGSGDSPSSRLQGYVSQSRVVGAKVWADRNVNNVLDFGETSDAATSNSGLFTLDLNQLDEIANYRLISTGGTARALTSAAAPVGVMLAPRGAKNITPLTTVVALNTTLANAIASATGESYDVDIAKSGGVSPTALRLAKGIETFMYVFGRNESGILTNVDDQISAITYLSTRLGSATLTDTTSIQSAIDSAVDDTIDGIPSLAFLTNAIKTSLKSEVSSAAKSVMDSISSSARKITEASIISACSNAFAATDLVKNDTLGNVSKLTLAQASGKVVQSYVNGATVFIDFDNDLVQDANETAVTTGTDGSYTLSYNNAANPSFQLVSVGGTKVDASGNTEPASLMLAPKGASNISLLTTLAALDSNLAAKLGANYDADLASTNGVSAQLLRLAKVVESYAQAFSTSNSPYFAERQDQQKALQLLANQLDTQFANSSALLGASALDLQSAVGTTILNVNSNFGITVDATLSTSLAETAYLVAVSIPMDNSNVLESAYQTTVDSYINTLQTKVGAVTPVTSSLPNLNIKQITALDTSSNTVVNSAASTPDTTIEYGAVFDNLTMTFGTSNLARGENATITNFTVEIVSGVNITQLVVPKLTVSRSANASNDVLSFSMTDNTTVTGSANSTGTSNTSATYFTAGSNTLTLKNTALPTNYGTSLKATGSYNIVTSGTVTGRTSVSTFDNTSVTVKNPTVAVHTLRIDNTTGNNIDNDTVAGASDITDNVTITSTGLFANVDNITMVFNVADLYDGYSYQQTGTTIAVEDDDSTDNRSLQLTLPTLTFARTGTHGGAGHSSVAGTISISESTDNITVDGRIADNSSATSQTAVITGLTGSTSSSELVFSYDNLSDNVSLTNLLNLQTFDNYTITITSDNSSVFRIHTGE
jgi:hypothetical protein